MSSRSLLARVNRKRSLFRDRALIPKETSAADLYLVEYPKSGITWLSVLLANTLLIQNGWQSRATFSSIRGYIPDLHVSRAAVAAEFRDPWSRLYKTHSGFNPSYVRSIYLAREPLDVMRSYHAYSGSLGYTNCSLRDFVGHPRFGIEQWKKHVNSWFSYPHNSNQHFVHLIRYEDLLLDAASQIKILAANLGWFLSDSAICEAVEISSRSSMKSQEALYASRNPSHKMRFVGDSNPSMDAPQDVVERIEAACRNERRLLGYLNVADS